MLVDQIFPEGYRPRPSRTKGVIFIVLLASVWLSLAVSLQGWVLLLSLVAMALWSVHFWSHHVAQNNPRMIRALQFDRQSLRLARANGESLDVGIVSGSFIDGAVLVLTLEPLSGHWLTRWLRRECLLWFPDQFHSDEWSHLLLHCSIRTRLHKT